MNKDTSVLVIGANGFVGSAITAQARKLGLNIETATRENYSSLIGKSFDLIINANGNSRKYLAEQDPNKDFEMSTLSVMRSLKDFTAGFYIYISSVDVYTNFSDPSMNTESTVIETNKQSNYGFHKYLSEQLVKRNSAKWLILRAAGLVGPGLWKNSIYDLLSNAELRVNPDSKYQYLNTADFASIIFSLIDTKISNDTFNVAGDGIISIREIAEMIPDCRLPKDTENLPEEHYEICIDKLKSVCDVPETISTVKTFIKDVLDGRIKTK